MPHININNSNYYYELHGEGQPIVLIAGYSCDHFFWDNVLPGLAEKFQVLVFDNRGIGQTQDNHKSFTLEQMADETFALMDVLKLVQPIVVGQSMGGIIARIIAIKYPESINRLILLNTASEISFRTLMALEQFIKLLKEGALIDTVIEASMPWFYSSHFLKNRINIDTIKQALLANPFPQSLVDLERQFHALKSFDSTHQKEKIATDTLILAAEEDIVCLPNESKRLATAIQQVCFKMLSGGHSSPVEVPNEIIEHIFNFLLSDLSKTNVSHKNQNENRRLDPRST